MFFYQIFLGVTVFAPVGGGVWGKYVTGFRAWCFGYDSSTGTMRWAAAWVLLTVPVFLHGLILLIWRKPLFEMIRFYPKKILPHLSAALGVVTALAGGLLFMAAKDQARDEIPFPFPGERIRVALEPPEIDLLNQHQEQVKLSDYSGKVVLLTAVYATCGTSCPMILLQAKELFERLPEEQKSEVVIFAISLDPEADSLEAMSNTATAFGLDLPQFQFLNGEPEIVNRVLDQLSIARL